MHNLSTVFKFEVVRTLKKKSFWIVAASFPLIIAAIAAVIYFSNETTNELAEEANNRDFSVVYTDESNLVHPALLEQIDAKPAASKEEGVAAVQDGKVDAYFHYPANVAKDQIKIYAKDVGLFDNGRYEAVAKLLLQTSAAQSTDPQTVAVLQDTVSTETTMYKDGVEYDGFKQMIAPGFFLVLFYILLAMFSNQMLTSTTEEKENRVIEMLLTTVKARTLIIGKILSLVVLAIIQVLLITIPTIVLYLVFKDQLSLPSFDLTGIPFDPLRISIAAIIFALSFLFFTGILVAIGAAMPTAKEANGFFGVVMVFLFGPLYAISLFVSAPTAPLVTFLSFFPLTAPIPLLLRNAVGNLSPEHALIAIAILAVSATVAMLVAVRIFRYGVIEYSSRLSLRTLFQKHKKRA